MNKKILTLLVSLFIVVMTSGAFAAPQTEIMVSGAKSLSDVFTEIGTSFMQKNPDVKVTFNFAASGVLARQIEGGAPVDVFASAALKEMKMLSDKNLILENSQKNFAANEIVLILAKELKVKVDSFKDLTNNDIKKIAIGNPDSVPAGSYAKEVLEYCKLWDILKDKYVYGENVRQVLDYVVRNEVDAGIVFLTDAILYKDLKTLSAPPKSHKEVIYPIAVVKASKNADVSKKFINFVLSKEGQTVLKKYGFKLIK